LPGIAVHRNGAVSFAVPVVHGAGLPGSKPGNDDLGSNIVIDEYN
jgi:hypothetical protein